MTTEEIKSNDDEFFTSEEVSIDELPEKARYFIQDSINALNFLLLENGTDNVRHSAYAEFIIPQTKDSYRAIYTTLNTGVLYTKEMQEDKVDDVLVQLLNLLVNSLKDDINIHLTPNTTLLVRSRFQYQIYRNIKTKDIHIIFRARVAQIPKGLNELRSWFTSVPESGEYKAV